MSPAGGAGGPLAGVRVVELGGLGPGPFCGMMLADLGAEVIRVDRPAEAGQETRHPVIHRGRTSIAVDLKHPEGADAVRQLIAGADAVIEGFRPGAVERLGLGPDVCLASNPKLVYGRMTGWGQDGPLAQEPGYDINYIALAGALHAIAPAGGDPVPPVNLIGDFGGGGMLLALGLVSALLHARTTGEGQVVDAAMTDGTALLLSMTYGFLSQGGWEDKPGVNLLDGGVPFYAVYRCADDRHVALGAIEPHFYAALLGVLGLAEEPEFARRRDRETWPAMKARLTRIFATRTRDEWGPRSRGRVPASPPSCPSRKRPSTRTTPPAAPSAGAPTGATSPRPPRGSARPRPASPGPRPSSARTPPTSWPGRPGSPTRTSKRCVRRGSSDEAVCA